MNHNLSTILTAPLASLAPLPSFSFVVPHFPTTLILSLTLITIFVTTLPKLIRNKRVYRVLLQALRYGGPIPKHVAFIMDGNRRWARRLGLSASSGHPQGGEKLIESLQWCLEAGVDTVTVFAFSIENFKRSKEEVSEIMSLAERTFHRFRDTAHVIHERRVRIKFLGDWNFISPSIRKLMAKLVLESSHYTDGPTLNIAFSYAARHDIATAVHDVVNLSKQGHILPEHIDETLIEACLASGCGKGAVHDQPWKFPDLLVRTSGETRLSDFLLWETRTSVLSFYPALWPEFSVWDFVKVILQYQKDCRVRDAHYASLSTSPTLQNSSSGKDRNEGEATNNNCRKYESLIDDAIEKVRQEHFQMISSFNSD